MRAITFFLAICFTAVGCSKPAPPDAPATGSSVDRSVTSRPRQDAKQDDRTAKVALDTPKEESRQIRELFRQLDAGWQSGTPNPLAEHFNFDRAASALRDEGFVGNIGLTTMPEETFRNWMKQTFTELFERMAHAYRWRRVDIKRIKILDASGEAAVVFRMWPTDGPVRKERWWLTKASGQWKVYDLENLDIGGRMSVGIAMVSASKDKMSVKWEQARRNFRTATQARLAGDLVEAERLMLEPRDAELPAEMEAIRWMGMGSIKLDQMQFEQALELYDKAESLNPAMPALDHLRALAHNMLGNHEAALTHARRYLDVLGDDPDAYLQVGNALYGMDRREESAEAFRKGLREDPQSWENLAGLGVALAPENKAEIGEWFTQADDAATAFVAVAKHFVESEDADALAALIAAAHRMQAAIAELPLYEAELQWQRGEYTLAAKLFAQQQGDLAQDEQRRWWVADRLIRSLVRLQRFDEALQIAGAFHEREKDPWFMAVAHAASGDVENCAAALGQCAELGYSADDFYADPEIGAALRSEAFARLRETYPDPAPAEEGDAS